MGSEEARQLAEKIVSAHEAFEDFHEWDADTVLLARAVLALTKERDRFKTMSEQGIWRKRALAAEADRDRLIAWHDEVCDCGAALSHARTVPALSSPADTGEDG